MKNYIFLLIFFIIFVVSCDYFTLMSQKEWLEKLDDDDKYDIYVCGQSANGNACYWKNDDCIDSLGNGSGKTARAIYVVGTDVFTVGFDGTGSCYWINDQYYELDGEEVHDIVVKKGNIYIAGWYDDVGGNDQACYWKNGVKYLLPGTLQSQAKSIFVFDDFDPDVYIGGNANNVGCYWKNGNLYSYGINYDVLSIFVANYTDVFTSGKSGTNGIYYKNNIQTTVVTLGVSSCYSIFVNKSDVHISYIDNTGSKYYYKNGISTLLAPPAGLAGKLTIFNGDVYIVGNDGTNNGYWKNGVFNSLSSSTATSDIFIIKKQFFK